MKVVMMAMKWIQKIGYRISGRERIDKLTGKQRLARLKRGETFLNKDTYGGWID